MNNDDEFDDLKDEDDDLGTEVVLGPGEYAEGGAGGFRVFKPGDPDYDPKKADA